MAGLNNNEEFIRSHLASSDEMELAAILFGAVAGGFSNLVRDMINRVDIDTLYEGLLLAARRNNVEMMTIFATVFDNKHPIWMEAFWAATSHDAWTYITKYRLPQETRIPRAKRARTR